MLLVWIELKKTKKHFPLLVYPFSFLLQVGKMWKKSQWLCIVLLHQVVSFCVYQSVLKI